MILLYPLLLVVAFVVMRRRRGLRGGRGAAWFAGWTAAGALFTFSFVTGFSIGLLFFPAVAALVLWLAARSPGREALGFGAGVGLIVLLAAGLNA